MTRGRLFRVTGRTCPPGVLPAPWLSSAANQFLPQVSDGRGINVRFPAAPWPPRICGWDFVAGKVKKQLSSCGPCSLFFFRNMNLPYFLWVMDRPFTSPWLALSNPKWTHLEGPKKLDTSCCLSSVPLGILFIFVLVFIRDPDA